MLFPVTVDQVRSENESTRDRLRRSLGGHPGERVDGVFAGGRNLFGGMIPVLVVGQHDHQDLRS